MNISLKDKVQVSGAADVYPIMQQILLREQTIDRNREHFWTLSLDVANTLINLELVSMGSAKMTVVEPMEVFSIPLQKRAAKVILVHNHPSGQLVPSESDKDITDRLISVGRIMDTPVLDHLIITETSYYSFVDSRLLRELQKSLKYVPPYQIKERMEEIALMERTDKALEMARAMLEKGEPLDKIIAYTGLSESLITDLKSR